MTIEPGGGRAVRKRQGVQIKHNMKLGSASLSCKTLLLLLLLLTWVSRGWAYTTWRWSQGIGGRRGQGWGSCT